MKLSEAQRRALEAMPIEYMEWGLDLFTPLPDGVKSRSVLRALERKGLAACIYGAMARTWNITEAGRSALNSERPKT